MLSFRSTRVVPLWSGVLLGAAIPASGQCEFHEDAKLTAWDPGEDDRFGMRIAIDGGLAIVGVLYADGPAGADQGSAYVFVKPVSGWSGAIIETAKLTASDAARGDSFGYSVAASGSLAVV